MITVEIKEPSTMFVADISPGELFRDKDGHIYLMTDEDDCEGNVLALSITTKSTFGILENFNYDEKVTKLNGKISVEIY